MQAFLHGFILAIGLILPLGVQNLFVFNQGAVQPSLVRALPAVIAAGMSDTLLIMLAVQGVSLLLLQFSILKGALIGIGVLFLLYMAWLTWHSRGAGQTGDGEGLSVKQQILFAVSVSLLNPHAVLDTIGVIGTSSVSYQGQEKLFFTLACIMVSWLWFFGLAVLGRIIGTSAAFSKSIAIINRVSALFMLGSAVYMAASAL